MERMLLSCRLFCSVKKFLLLEACIAVTTIADQDPEGTRQATSVFRVPDLKSERGRRR